MTDDENKKNEDPSKDAASSEKDKPAAKKAPAKKSAPAKKTTAAKKAASSPAQDKVSEDEQVSEEKSQGQTEDDISGYTPELRVGTQLTVTVDPRRNNGASEAVGFVTLVNEEGRVNIRVFLDTGENQRFTDIEVSDEKPDYDPSTGERPTKVAWRF